MLRSFAAAIALFGLTALEARADQPGSVGLRLAPEIVPMGQDFSRRTGRLGFGHDPTARPETDFFGASGLGRSRDDILSPVDRPLGAATRIAPFPVVEPTPPVRPKKRVDGDRYRTLPGRRDPH